jgi:HAD superfamily hydrolase (TIGR01509 family)
MASVRLAAGAAGLFGSGTVTNLPSVVAWAERPHTAGMAPTHSSSGSAARRPLEAVVFDLDGVLIEGEEVWDAVRQGLVRARGGHWVPGATAAMMGMSSPEWSRYMAEELGVPMAPAAIIAETVAGVAARYEEALPLVPGAVEVVRELAQHWPLGLASSANRPIIELVLDRAGLTGCFRATVSSEEVARGKPAPDVYLEVARRLGVAADRCAAVEDSANGLRSAAAAGMWVVAVPNRRYPPPPELVQAADLVVATVGELTPAAISGLGRG